MSAMATGLQFNPSQLNPSQLKSSQLKPSQLKPSQLNPSQLNSSHLKSSQLTSVCSARPAMLARRFAVDRDESAFASCARPDSHGHVR